MEECNIKEIGVNDVRMILASLEFYASSLESDANNKGLVFLKKSKEKTIRELKSRIEETETCFGSVKEVVIDYEKVLLEQMEKQGKSKEELNGMFMYI